MTILTKNRIRGVILALSLCLAANAAPERNPEEIRMCNTVYQLFEGNDSAAFNKAVRQLKEYYREKGDWEKFYTTWENGIIYHINHDYYYQALKSTNQLHSHILENQHHDELYRKDFLMGAFYGTRDNSTMCEKHLNQALKQIGKDKNATELANIYMLLANLHLFSNTDAAIRDIDMAAAYSKDNYQRSAILQMKCIIAFFKNDKKNFNKTYAQVQKIKKNDPENYDSTYERYAEICRMACEERYDEAISMCENIEERETDKYLLQARIHEKKGDKDAIIAALKKLMNAREKRINEISTMEINEMSHDMRLASMDHKTRIAYRLITLLAFITTFIIVTFLVIFGLSKRRHVKELKAQNRELKRARARAEEADRMKAAFIRNASHQIRTPLNAISGFSSILARQVDDLQEDEREDLAQRIEHNAALISNSLNYLLALSEAESVRVADQEDSVNCNALCSSIAREFKPMNTNLCFCYSSSLGDHVSVKTDQEALTKIIMELLTNADKFTEKGQIMLNSDMEGGMWQIAVSDTGRGIPPGDEQRIFGQFSKIDELSEGLGLGLAFCKNIAVQLGGDVMLDRSYTDGARFVVTLPLKRA